MQRKRKIAFLLLLVLFFSGIFTHFYSLYQQQLNAGIKIDAPKSECICDLNGVQHDFCYRLPAAPQVHGKRFNCKHAAHLETLDLLSDSNAIDMKINDIPEPMFVSAMSDNHYKEGLTLIANIRKLWPQQKIVIYNLGLNNNAIEELKAKCLVELRDFPFHDYPAYVSYLKEYRWKPLVISITVKEFGAIWYMDTSVRWRKDRRGIVYSEINCRKNKDWSETLDIFGNDTVNCKKPGYLLHSSAGHSVFATTHPGVYDFIPTVTERLRTESSLCHAAGFAFVVRTSDTISILKWNVLCALERNCMAPPGALIACKFETINQ